MAVRTKNRPEVKHILRRVSCGLAGVNEAALLKDLLDAMDDRITALKLQQQPKQEQTRAEEIPGLLPQTHTGKGGLF